VEEEADEVHGQDALK